MSEVSLVAGLFWLSVVFRCLAERLFPVSSLVFHFQPKLRLSHLMVQAWGRHVLICICR